MTQFGKSYVEDLDRKPVIKPVRQEQAVVSVEKVSPSASLPDVQKEPEKIPIKGIELKIDVQEMSSNHALKSDSWIQAEAAIRRASTSVWKEPRQAADQTMKRFNPGSRHLNYPMRLL